MRATRTVHRAHEKHGGGKEPARRAAARRAAARRAAARSLDDGPSRVAVAVAAAACRQPIKK